MPDDRTDRREYSLTVNGRPHSFRIYDPEDPVLPAARVLDEASTARLSETLYAHDPDPDRPAEREANAGEKLDEVDPREHDRVIALYSPLGHRFHNSGPVASSNPTRISPTQDSRSGRSALWQYGRRCRTQPTD